VCGKCVVRHVGGSPRHHDLILSPQERLESLTTCVSGHCEGLELDL
jgi:hypothetical protein